MSFAGQNVPLIRGVGTEDYDSSSTDSGDTARNSYSRSRAPFGTSITTTAPGIGLGLFPPVSTSSGRSSGSSSLTTTPTPSRSVSPLPQFFSSAPSSSSASDTDSEPNSPLLGRSTRHSWPREERNNWWNLGAPSRRRRRRDGKIVRYFKKAIRSVLRHPFFPTQPITIVLFLLLFSVFAICLTLLLMYILNPDKEPLPWRAYCSTRGTTAYPGPKVSLSSPFIIPSMDDLLIPEFPPANFDDLAPVGVLVGVFSMDSAFERRMLVRTTWASHARSREGAGAGDAGRGTSRMTVRFILGVPRSDWERRVQLEMETYNDIIILPMMENMNSGKTHSYFSWAALHAWVPPVYYNTTTPPAPYSYSNFTSPPPNSLAAHDPIQAREDHALERPLPWVRPDYVLKVDDDSFVMLAELEARLRVHLRTGWEPPKNGTVLPPAATPLHMRRAAIHANVSTPTYGKSVTAFATQTVTSAGLNTDPLVYWGYLVKNQFMAGELYALSWSLVDWASKDPAVKTMTKGKEDKTTARWMQSHPRKTEIKWASEHCWIYDHPRAGTVYSHGFLFPSEVSRVKKTIRAYLEKFEKPTQTSDSAAPTETPRTHTPLEWAHSSVSSWGVRYSPPVSDLTMAESIEALVEGSDMSLLRDGSPMTPEYAWSHREGREKRYESKRVGGTIVVHFIKKNMWFLEAAQALLEGEDLSETEDYQRREKERDLPGARRSFGHRT